MFFLLISPEIYKYSGNSDRDTNEVNTARLRSYFTAVTKKTGKSFSIPFSDFFNLNYSCCFIFFMYLK